MPVYLAMLGKNADFDQESKSGLTKWRFVFNGVLFVLGFTLVFLGSGLLIALIGGYIVTSVKIWIARIGGLLIILLGLNLAGIIHIKFLEYDWKIKNRRTSRRSLLESFLLGIIFAAGWSACTGPILGTILTFTLIEGKIMSGLINLQMYSLGLAIPFIIAVIFTNIFSRFFNKYKNALRIIQIVSGIILVILGVLLVSGLLTRLLIIVNS